MVYKNMLLILSLRGAGMASSYIVVLMMPIWLGLDKSGSFFYVVAFVAWFVFVLRSQIEPVIYNKIAVDIKKGRLVEGFDRLNYFNLRYSIVCIVFIIFAIVFWDDLDSFNSSPSVLLLLLPVQLLLLNFTQLLICLGRPNLGYFLGFSLPSVLIIVGCLIFLSNIGELYCFIVLASYVIPYFVAVWVIRSIKRAPLDYQTLRDVAGDDHLEGFSVTKLFMSILQQVPINFPIILVGYFYVDSVSQFTQIHKIGLLCSVFLSVFMATRTSSVIDVVESGGDFLSLQFNMRKKIYKINFIFMIFVFFLYWLLVYYSLLDIEQGGGALLLMMVAQLIAARSIGCGLYLKLKKSYASIIYISLLGFVVGLVGFYLLSFYSVVLAGAGLAALFVSVVSALSLYEVFRLEKAG